MTSYFTRHCLDQKYISHFFGQTDFFHENLHRFPGICLSNQTLLSSGNSARDLLKLNSGEGTGPRNQRSGNSAQHLFKFGEEAG